MFVALEAPNEVLEPRHVEDIENRHHVLLLLQMVEEIIVLIFVVRRLFILDISIILETLDLTLLDSVRTKRCIEDVFEPRIVRVNYFDWGVLFLLGRRGVDLNQLRRIILLLLLCSGNILPLCIGSFLHLNPLIQLRTLSGPFCGVNPRVFF